MESPIHHDNTVHYLWYTATFGYIFQSKNPNPLMFVLSPLILPGPLFKSLLACLVVFKAVSILSGWGVNLLIFALPLMLQVSGHLAVGIALICICYFIYKAILHVCCFGFEPRTTTALLPCISWLIYEECYIVLHICGLVSYAMLYFILSYLTCMLVLLPWLCQNAMNQFLASSCSKMTEIVSMPPEEQRQILKSQDRQMSEVKEKPEKKELTDETTVKQRSEASQKTSREKEIENIRRSILTTNLTKENVKDMWLKKQQSRRGRRRWARMSNNALSVSVSPMSQDW